MTKKFRIVIGFIDCDGSASLEIGTGEGKKELTGKDWVCILKKLAEADGYKFEHARKSWLV